MLKTTTGSRHIERMDCTRQNNSDKCTLSDMIVLGKLCQSDQPTKCVNKRVYQTTSPCQSCILNGPNDSLSMNINHCAPATCSGNSVMAPCVVPFQYGSHTSYGCIKSADITTDHLTDNVDHYDEYVCYTETRATHEAAKIGSCECDHVEFSSLSDSDLNELTEMDLSDLTEVDSDPHAVCKGLKKKKCKKEKAICKWKKKQCQIKN